MFADKTRYIPSPTSTGWLSRRVAAPRPSPPRNHVWVFLELPASPLSWGLVGEGKQLAERRGVELSAVLLGASSRQLQEVALQAFGYGVDTIHMIDAPAFAHYQRDPFTGALAGLVERYRPGAVLFAASPVAHDLADNLSAALGIAAAGEVCELDDDRLGIAAITPDPGATPCYQADRAGHIILEPPWATGWARA